METKKATKTVKSPFGWSKSVRAVGKCSAMDSTGGSISSGGGGSGVSESSSRLEDSALLISPPNQATFSEASPRPYFLRGHPKYSSTPLLPNNDNKGEPLVGINLEDRLQSLEEHRNLSDDSGFDTLTSTDSSSPASSTRPTSPPPRALGALPKRRSPRNLSKNLSTKVSGGAKVEKPGSFVNFTSSGSCFPPSQKRALFKYEPRQHLDGRDTCDVVRMLFEMNLGHVLGLLFQYCGGSQLCAIAQVSQLWNLALVTSNAHNDRRLAWIALRKRNQENDGFTAPSRLGPASPRRVMQQLNNQLPRGSNGGSNGSGGKRDRAGSVAALVSPSKVRHRLFVEEARMLSPGERLTHCPLCTSPSRVSASRAQCSSSKCSFVFCPDCLCEHHEGRGCRLTRTGSKVPKSGAVTSKKSKARLRRL